jgi:hypothetical protein
MKLLYTLVALMSIVMMADAKKSKFVPTEVKGYFVTTYGK